MFIMRWSLVLIPFLYSFFVASLYCQDLSPFEIVERHIAEFDPPVYSSPGGSPCQGLVISSERVIMAKECATVARQIMLSGSVTVNNVYGERVGVLPDLSGDSVLQVQAAGLSEMEVLFVSDQNELMDKATYPQFISEPKGVEEDYFVFTGGEDLQWLPVGVNPVDGSGQEFSLTTVDERLGEKELERLATGSVVVNERGWVCCLVGVDGVCHLTSDYSASTMNINDGTCHLHVVNCTDIRWSSCSNGEGLGTCINPYSNDSCTVGVISNGTDKCRHKGGCGSFYCGCYQDSCDCIGSYGFCEYKFESETKPHGCIPGSEGYNPRDPGCKKLNPITPSTKPSTKPDNMDKNTLGLVIGLPAGFLVLAVATLATTVGIVIYCLHRRAGYETISN